MNPIGTGPWDQPTPSAEAKNIIVHLISHASGELVEMLVRNAVAQLDGVNVDRTLWKMVRHLGQVPEILAAIAEKRGFAFHSISDEEIRGALEEGCRHLRVPCVFILEPFVSQLAEHFDVGVRFHRSIRDAVDEDYYRRVEAMKYTLAHDDGLNSHDLEAADVVLIGVSRATKTPTCMYLASRGIKAANVPLVPGVPLPEGVAKARNSLVVGLTISPEVLAQVRENRLRRLNEAQTTDYSEIESVRREVLDAKRLFARNGWRQIDVTSRSVEQTASMIIEILKRRAEAARGSS